MCFVRGTIECDADERISWSKWASSSRWRNIGANQMISVQGSQLHRCIPMRDVRSLRTADAYECGTSVGAEVSTIAELACPSHDGMLGRLPAVRQGARLSSKQMLTIFAYRRCQRRWKDWLHFRVASFFAASTVGWSMWSWEQVDHRGWGSGRQNHNCGSTHAKSWNGTESWEVGGGAGCTGFVGSKYKAQRR